ncbi:Hint domain-containing protein [Jannaschia marina]|uniref:Hint domain-containing protein n=1 Tax=Jannaschia marina TaxID=2741674 RepID=UPI0015C734EA|nr:Hint domain-containing protein [Jannaschia marina]
MTVQLRQNAETLAKTDAAVVVAQTIKGGIARGTVILTARGEVPVEHLRAGDRVITRERGMSVLKAVTGLTAAACSIRTDSLGLGRPERDTTVACDQHIAVRDWRAEALFDAGAALVPARRLADGKQIAAFGEADFFRLDFGTPLTVYANGLETPVGRTEDGIVDISTAG